MLKMILAIDKDNLVGKTDGNYGLAWHYKEDMDFYKENCINKINVYGRKTLEKIGRVLPNREMICLTRDPNYNFEGVKTVTDIDYIIELSKTNDIMINGGVEVFKLFLNHIDQMIITKIDASHIGDVYYNEFSTEGFKLTKSIKEGILSFEYWDRI